MKIKINVGKLTYTPVGFDIDYPLPIGIQKRAEIEVVGQLKRNEDVDWKVDYLPFELTVDFPRIHFIGEGYIETFPYREFFKIDNKKPTLQIAKKRRGLLVVITFDEGELRDLFKRDEKIEFKKKVFEEIGERKPEIRQGHLSGHFFWKNKIPEDICIVGRRFRFLNHEFYCRKPFQWAECNHNGEYFAILHCPEGEYIYLVSPDHLDSPYLLSPGNYYFIHPEPGEED